MRSKSTSALFVLLAAAALPSSSSAAGIVTERECYVSAGGTTQPIVFAANGLTPGARYGVTFRNKKGLDTGVAFGDGDGAGNWIGQIASWSGGSSFTPTTTDNTLILKDQATQAEIASVRVKTAPVTFDVTGSKKLRSWKISGLAALTGGKTYYAHYFNNNKYKGRLKVGKASGPCGIYKGKRPLTPFSKLGRYDVKITTNKKYNSQDLALEGRIKVTVRYR